MLRKTMPDTFSLELELYLPVTLECLWTLGEMNHSPWQLYRNLPQIQPDASSRG